MAKQRRKKKDSAFVMRSKGGKARATLDPARLSAIGRMGGEARRDALTPEARAEAARKAVNKRWDEHRAALAALEKKQGKAGGRVVRSGSNPRTK